MKNGQKTLLYINISIILVLMIFIGLLVSTLETLLHIHHGTRARQIFDNSSDQTMIFEYKLSQLCPSHYRYWMQAQVSSYYDGNCSFIYVNIRDKVNDAYENDMVTIHEHKKVNKTDQYATNGIRIIRPMSVQVTDIILASMLIVSVISALVEMLRNRFMNHQNTSMRFASFGSRRPSIADIILPKRCRSQKFTKSPVRIDSQGSHRTSLRTIGAYTSTIMHRSSFSIYFNFGGNMNGASQSLCSLRQISVDADAEAGVGTSSGLPHRSRLIRHR